MDENNIFRLTSGKIYITDNGDDAFIVRSGVLLVYVVAYRDDNYGRRDFLYEAKSGEVIPSFCYTDINLQNRRFLFTSRSGVELGIIPRGATKKLKAGFLEKLGFGDVSAEGFNKAITDSVRAAEAADEAFIARSQSMRAETSQSITQLLSQKRYKRDYSRNMVSVEKGSLPQTMRLIGKSLRCTKPLQTAGRVALTPVTAVLMTALPLFIFAVFRRPDGQAGVFPPAYILLLLAAVLIAAVTRYLSDVFSASAALSVARQAEKTVFRRFFSLEHRYFREHETARIAYLMMNAKRVAVKVMTKTYSFLGEGVSAAVCLIFCIWLSPVLSGIGLLLLLVWMALYVFALRMVRKYRGQARQYGNRSDSLMYQFITGITKIRLAGAEEKATLEYLKPYVEREKAEENRYRAVKFFHDIFSVSVILIAAVFCIAASRLDRGISFERWAAFVCVYTMLSSAVSRSLRAFLSVGEEREYIDVMTETMTEYAENEGDPQTGATPQVDGGIDIDHLTFSYEGDGNKVLEDFSLHIEAGEYVAIVGESGCGKTTLLKLLLGFETPDSGTIRYSGTDLSQMDLHHLRRQVGTVLQDGRLISGTIEENIMVTKPDATAPQVQAAIRAAGLEEDLYRMPMGTRTVLSEDGEMVSGGQRQKILIARALLSKPKILFFDEATGALDNLSQKTVTDTLAGLSATRVVIAHRLSTVMGCDRIIVLRDGGIAEQGTYDELMEKEGLFFSMAKRQII